jgi:hypothetical protein
MHTRPDRQRLRIPARLLAAAEDWVEIGAARREQATVCLAPHGPKPILPAINSPPAPGLGADH